MKITRAIESDPVVFIRMQIENAIADGDLERALTMTQMMDDISISKLKTAESSQRR